MPRKMLPLSDKTEQSIETIETIEPEIVSSKPVKTSRGAGSEIVSSVAQSLPDIINVVQSVADIWKVYVESEADVKRLREQGNYLLAEASKFVQEEAEKRQTMRDRQAFLMDVWGEVLNYLKTETDESVKKAVLDHFSAMIQTDPKGDA